MTIEASTPAQPAGKAGSTAEARGHKAAGSGKGSGAPATGFMAVLAALDDQGSTPGALQTVDVDENAALPPADSAQAAMDLIANSMPPETNPTLDATDMGAAGLANTLVAAGTQPAAVVPVAGAGVQAVPRPATPARAGAGATGLEADGGQGASPDAGTAQGVAKAKPAVSATSQLADAKASAVPADAAKVQDAKFMATLEAMKVLQGGSTEPVATVAATATTTPSTLAERSSGERTQLREQDTGGQYTPQFNSMGATSYASSSVQDAGAVSSEMYVAQQVSYWISQDVQNAELTLDGLGQTPVEVSISMSGNEAHIAFRSDEAQTLRVLDGAAAHLKDMLQGQGLVLSGVSVGTSGSGDAGDSDRRQRQGTRQQSATVPVAAAEARRMPAGATGRTLDLFV